MSQAKELFRLIGVAACADQMNYSSGRMLAEAAEACGKPVGEITLAEFETLYRQAVKRHAEETEMRKNEH